MGNNVTGQHCDEYPNARHSARELSDPKLNQDHGGLEERLLSQNGGGAANQVANIHKYKRTTLETCSRELLVRFPDWVL